MGIKYTSAEQDLLDTLSIRQWKVLSKLARLLGSQKDYSTAHTVSLTTFIGEGYDDFDSKRILKITSNMKFIIKHMSLQDSLLNMEFLPEALPLIQKMAPQAASRPFRGNGEAFCEAILALKMALE